MYQNVKLGILLIKIRVSQEYELVNLKQQIGSTKSGKTKLGQTNSSY